jgi:hypothetical protein
MILLAKEPITNGKRPCHPEGSQSLLNRQVDQQGGASLREPLLDVHGFRVKQKEKSFSGTA